MADTSLLFNIIGRDRTGPAFRSAADGASKLGGRMKTGLLAGAAALGAVSVGAFALGKDMVNIASNTNEALSKTNTVFGKAAAEAIKFSDESAAAYGISKRAALDYTSGMGSVLVAMGDSQDAAAKTSLEYTKLAADMASFNNTSIEEAAEALKASLTGEFEQMKKYGVVINDTRLSQEALAMGMKKDGATWTAQQKKILSHSIILKDTAQAQGDFARTSGGMANQQRILGARMEDLKGKIGEKLLPVVVKAMGWLNKGIDIAYKLGRALAPVARGVEVFFKALGGGSEANEFSGNLRKANNAGVKLGDWIRNDFLPVARRFASWFKNEAVPAIKRLAREVWANLKPNIQALAATIRTHILPAVQNFIGKVREAWPTIRRLANILLQVAAFLTRRVLPVLIRFAGPVLGLVIRVVGQTISTVFRLIGVFMNLGKGVANAISKTIGFVKRLPGQVVSAIGSLSRTLWQHGLDLIQGFINGIVEKAKSLPGVIKDKVVGVAKDALHGFGLFGSPSRLTMKYGRWWTEGFAIGMKDKSKDVVDRAKEMVDKLKEKLSEVKDFAKQIREAFVSFADVTSIDTLISGDDGDTEGGFAKLLADLQGRAAGAAKFNSALAQLRKMGLNETTLGQLRESGPESGLKSAQQILGAGAGGVGQVNAAVRSILASGSALGNREAKALYGIDPSKSQKLKVTIGGNVKISADVNSFIKVLRQEIRAQGGDVQKVLGKA